MKSMRTLRFCCIFAAVILLFTAAFSLCACDSSPKELQFKNELDTTVNVYFSSAADDEWSDKPTRIGVRSGAQFGLDFSDFDGSSGKKTDIGAIDENSVNFDVYEVVLNEGDLIVLSGSESDAVFTITHSDGTSSTYAAMIKAPTD